MLVGNYGGHMAFTTVPPYCVAYAADYQNKDPSKMTPRESFKSCVRHGNRQHDGEKAVVFAKLGSSREEPHQGWSSSNPERCAVQPQVVSRNSHTMQPCGSARQFNNMALAPLGSLLHCRRSGPVESTLMSARALALARWYCTHCRGLCVVESGHGAV